MINLLKVSVVDEDILKELIQEGSCTSIDDLDPSVPQEYDYAETTLIDQDKNHILYWNDNIHSNPKLFINGFIKALKYTGIKHSVKEICMLNKDLKIMSGDVY